MRRVSIPLQTGGQDYGFTDDALKGERDEDGIIYRGVVGLDRHRRGGAVQDWRGDRGNAGCDQMRKADQEGARGWTY